jgi:ATP-binding cassette, subfamily C, type I secretion system permease/ATPase
LRSSISRAAAFWPQSRYGSSSASRDLFEGAVQSRLLKGAAYGPEAMADLAVVRSFVTSPGMTALFDLPWVAIFIAAAFLLHPYFGLLSVGYAAVLVSLALVGERITRKPLQAVDEANIALRRQLDATARNAEVIESMGMMRALSNRWTGRNAELTGSHGEVLDRSTLLASITKFVRLFVQTETEIGEGGQHLSGG